MNADKTADLVITLRDLADAIENCWVEPTFVSQGIVESGHSVLILRYLRAGSSIRRN